MFPVVEIIRLEENERSGTFGIIRVQKEIVCYSLEPPDLLNLKNKSSIPAQQYWVKKRVSPTHGLVYHVQDVPGRTYIYFHPGVRLEHTEGCILTGLYIAVVGGKRVLIDSQGALRMFYKALDNADEFHLTIYEKY